MKKEKIKISITVKPLFTTRIHKAIKYPEGLIERSFILHEIEDRENIRLTKAKETNIKKRLRAADAAIDEANRIGKINKNLTKNAVAKKIHDGKAYIKFEKKPSIRAITRYIKHLF